jgi:glycosyltransferase involved in cell wall biosynthesis
VTPNTIIEAMAMALPVISSRSGAIPELIEDGVSGLLVAPRDETALAAGIARLLGDGALRRALGTAARRRAEERFDSATSAARYAELFGFRAAETGAPSARAGK